MNAAILALVFLALIVGFVMLGRYYDRQHKRSEFRRRMGAMEAAIQEVSVAIGEQFLPVMQQTTTAFQQFAEALRREDT